MSVWGAVTPPLTHTHTYTHSVFLLDSSTSRPSCSDINHQQQAPAALLLYLCIVAYLTTAAFRLSRGRSLAPLSPSGEGRVPVMRS